MTWLSTFRLCSCTVNGHGFVSEPDRFLLQLTFDLADFPSRRQITVLFLPSQDNAISYR
jgi:hypothetical protein